jgi:transposase
VLARRHGLSRRTLRHALTLDLPPTRSRTRPTLPALASLQPVIDAMAAHGCRAREIWTRLMNEYDTSVSLSTITIYLRTRAS